MKPKTTKFYLRSTSSVSLDERFSQIQGTFTPLLSGRSRMVNWKNEVSVVTLQKQSQRRRSVWTRLGWRRKCPCVSASRPRGFWSFMKKYNWRVRSISTNRRQPRFRFSRGGDPTVKRHCIKRNQVPTKKQLDAQLDKYMSSMSKSRLDAQLDEYMSKSKSRLDAELDEYMSMSQSRLDSQLDEYMSMSQSRLDAQLDEYMAMAGEATLWD